MAINYIYSKHYLNVSPDPPIITGYPEASGVITMARIDRGPYRSIWQDFDDLMAEMENRFQSVIGGIGARGEEVRERVVPAIRDFRVDVCDHEGEVIVVAELPGGEKENVSVRLLDPRHLEITSRRTEETGEESRDFFMRERIYGEMNRTVMLPVEVTEDNAGASFKNGVLEVRLKKAPTETGTTLPIE